MDESNPYGSPKADMPPRDAGVPTSQSVRMLASAPRESLMAAMLLVAVDVVISGSFLFSYLACPIWFLLSVVKNVIQRPGWRIALFRIAVPALTLGSVLVNNVVQWKIAEVNAERIIRACDDFHAANGRYPHTLDELVPQHLGSIPRAKYCLFQGELVYCSLDKEGSCCFFWWYKVPPFGKELYSFEDRRWDYLD